MSKPTWSRLLARAARAATDILNRPRSESRTSAGTSSGPRPQSPRTQASRQHRPTTAPSSSVSTYSGRSAPTAGSGARAAYPGDFPGHVDPIYSPVLDGDADPGEIVWTWVPYEEDHSQGKDRPVLIVGVDGPWLLGLMLTSRDHDADPHRSSPTGPRWLDIGSGPWDAKGRDSEIRLDRIIRIDPGAVRREGAIMDRATFDSVTHFLH